MDVLSVSGMGIPGTSSRSRSIAARTPPTGYHVQMRILALMVTLAACLAGAARAEAVTVRIATFNIAMGLEQTGQMAAALASGEDARLQKLAGILQRVRPDVVLLNEFDYDPGVDAAALLNDNYLARACEGQTPLRYPHSFRAPVNTGADSGLDLDGDGKIGGPGDAWGFGQFPGQYGMLVLSRYPVDHRRVRTFREFRWAALPDALRPRHPDGNWFHDDATWAQLRLSSKNHWDVPLTIGTASLHLLAHHPTPPVFDGPEDRNGRRNFDEIRFWRHYTDPAGASFLVDDTGAAGGIAPGSAFVIAGDFNADPKDGDAVPGAIGQLLEAAWIDARCVAVSAGGAEAARMQGGVNQEQQGDPAADTSDFNDQYTGNLRLDYLVPAAGLRVLRCGVFWPASGDDGRHLIDVSDHRLIWMDVAL
jgi:endonuclease/exonuclease/phosphatase family metal-dependent hydrolase